MARPAPGELEDVRPSRCHAACAAVELDPPLGFDPARLEAWPAVGAGSSGWRGGCSTCRRAGTGRGPT